jgi:hypothetical protein
MEDPHLRHSPPKSEAERRDAIGLRSPEILTTV